MEEVEGPSRSSAIWSNLIGRVKGFSARRKIAVLFLILASLYGGLIVLDGLGLRAFLNPTYADLPIYQERAKLILNGGMIYRDVPYGSLAVESPPLINYLFLPAQLAGGEWWTYEIWFSVFALLSALCMYLVLRHWDDHLAFLASVLYLLCPFLVFDATLGVQDEPIVAFFFIMPVLLFLRKNLKWATAGATVGFWTKFLSIILFPTMLLQMPTWKERFRHIGLAALVTLVVSLPFLIICPVEFLQFPAYYLLGREDGGAGMSAMGLLSAGGVVLPGALGALITVAALLATYWFCHKRQMDLWRSCLLVTVVFLSTYPMIRASYFMIPFAFLTVWAVDDKRILLRTVGMYVPIMISQSLEHSVNNDLLPASYAWISLVFLIIGLVVLADATRLAMKKKCFLDRPKGRAAPIFGPVPSATKVTSKTPFKAE